LTRRGTNRAPLGGKIAAVVSLTLWPAAIAAGRLLAYF
jgi:hypothetical protein